MGNCIVYEYINITGNIIEIPGVDCFSGDPDIIYVLAFESGETNCIRQLSAEVLNDLANQGLSMSGQLPECGTFPDPSPTPTPTPTATTSFVTPTPTPTVTPTASPFAEFFTATTCNTLINSNTWVGSGGRGIFTVNADAGSGIGNVTLFFSAFTIPDKFVVIWNGSTVIDTGFRGSATYNNDLNALGYPNVEGNGFGTATFTKTAASPTTVTIVVTAPLTGTAWRGILGCPIVIIPNTGTEISIGKVYNAFGIIPSPAGAGLSIGLNSTLGVNRQPPFAASTSIALSAQTALSLDFGGLSAQTAYIS
jgi:hypothetical protein